MDEILKLGALELAEKIRQGEFTATAAVQTHIERIQSINPKINAMVENRFQQALAEARLVDEAKGQPQGPLAGVPFTTKELFAVEGMKTTAGTHLRKDHRNAYDATAIARLRAAGAILLGTTNVPELGFWFETDNSVYGRTNNPYDLSRTPGGSSGGEAALVSACGSAFGIGSDVGGSARQPAAFCGLFSLKPTNRLTPISGHFPYTFEEMKELKGDGYPYTTVGMMTRKAKDLRPLLQITRGPDRYDQEIRDEKLLPAEQDVTKWTVLVCDDPVIHLTKRADPEVQQATRNAARYFEQLGATIEELDPRMFVRAVDLWSTAIRAIREKSYEEVLSPAHPLPLAREFVRALLHQPHQHTLPSLFTVLAERISFGAGGHAQEILAELQELKKVFAAKLSGPRILICPPHPRTAPKHQAPLLAPFDFVYAGIFNVLDGPAGVVPMGLDKNGMPLSVQLVSGRLQDEMIMNASEILEMGFGGWQEPRL